MPTNDDPSYFRHRALQERRQAEICGDDIAVRIHLHLAEAYDRKAAELTVRLSLVPNAGERLS